MTRINRPNRSAYYMKFVLIVTLVINTFVPVQAVTIDFNVKEDTIHIGHSWWDSTAKLRPNIMKMYHGLFYFLWGHNYESKIVGYNRSGQMVLYYQLKRDSVYSQKSLFIRNDTLFINVKDEEGHNYGYYIHHSEPHTANYIPEMSQFWYEDRRYRVIPLAGSEWFDTYAGFIDKNKKGSVFLFKTLPSSGNVVHMRGKYYLVSPWAVQKILNPGLGLKYNEIPTKSILAKKEEFPVTEYLINNISNNDFFEMFVMQRKPWPDEMYVGAFVVKGQLYLLSVEAQQVVIKTTTNHGVASVKTIYHAESRKTVNRWVESWEYSGSGKMRSTASVTLYEDEHYCLISINKKDVNITHVVP